MDDLTTSSLTLALRFISRINMSDVGLFVLSIVAIMTLTYFIRVTAASLAKAFPKRRMGVLRWVPVLNFALYFIGIAIFFYVIFEPSKQFVMYCMMSGFIALGFAFKDSVESIMAGVLLLTDKPFQVGDRVSFQQYYGDIIDIGLRSVKLKTLDQGVVTIPNHLFMSNSVKSKSVGHVAMNIDVSLYVSIEADLYHIQDILKEVGSASIYLDTTQPVEVFVKEILTDQGTAVFEVITSGLLKDARRESYFKTDFFMRAHKVFKEKNIILL